MAVHRLTKVLDAADPTSLPVTSDTLTQGANRPKNTKFMWDFSSNPSPAAGTVYLLARVSPDAEFAPVYDSQGNQYQLDLSNVAAPNWNIAGVGVPLFYQQKWVSDNVTVGGTPSVNAWISE